MKKLYNIILIITLIVGIIILLTVNNKTVKELERSIVNEKAYMEECFTLENKSREYKFTIEQLEYMNDSLSLKMNSLRKELQIKDKDLKYLQYLQSKATKIDTVIFTDTIFKDNSVNIDTIIGDKWYNIDMLLRYPNTIILEPTFVSEKFIIANYKKETLSPPKKCFIIRLFQKKHTIVEINIIEQNPYIENTNSRFVDIVK